VSVRVKMLEGPFPQVDGLEADPAFIHGCLKTQVWVLCT
jgi:hypothetical protein